MQAADRRGRRADRRTLPGRPRGHARDAAGAARACRHAQRQVHAPHPRRGPRRLRRRRRRRRRGGPAQAGPHVARRRAGASGGAARPSDRRHHRHRRRCARGRGGMCANPYLHSCTPGGFRTRTSRRLSSRRLPDTRTSSLRPAVLPAAVSASAWHRMCGRTTADLLSAPLPLRRHSSTLSDLMCCSQRPCACQPAATTTSHPAASTHACRAVNSGSQACCAHPALPSAEGGTRCAPPHRHGVLSLVHHLREGLAAVPEPGPGVAAAMHACRWQARRVGQPGGNGCARPAPPPQGHRALRRLLRFPAGPGRHRPRHQHAVRPHPHPVPLPRPFNRRPPADAPPPAPPPMSMHPHPSYRWHPHPHPPARLF